MKEAKKFAKRPTRIEWMYISRSFYFRCLNFMCHAILRIDDNKIGKHNCFICQSCKLHNFVILEGAEKYTEMGASVFDIAAELLGDQ